MAEATGYVPMTIMAFDDPKMSSASPDDKFVLPLSSATYSEKVEVSYCGVGAPGNNGAVQKFKKGLPNEQKFDFLLDGTMATMIPMDVSEMVSKFLDVTRKMEGKIHRPRYLKLLWDRKVFKCVLKSADISYSLFSATGKPLRAKINATFVEAKDPTLQDSESNKQSADLTHVRSVSQGDTLPLLANTIYGDPNYYIELARVNKLKNFRKLKTGDNLIFPPTE